MMKSALKYLLFLLLIINSYGVNVNNKIKSKELLSNNINLQIKEYEKDGAVFTTAFFIGLGVSILMSGGTAVANNVAAGKHRATNQIIAEYQAKCEASIKKSAQRLTKYFDDMKVEMKLAGVQAKLALARDQTYKSRHLSILLVQIIGSGEPEYVAKIARGTHLSGTEDTNVAVDVGLSIVQSFGEALLQEAGLSFIPGVGTVWSVGKLGHALYGISEAEGRTRRMQRGYKKLCHRSKERVKFQTCKNTHEIYEKMQNIHYTLKNLDERRNRILGDEFRTKLLTHVGKALQYAKNAYDAKTCDEFRKRPKAKCLTAASDNSKVCCPITAIWWGSIHEQHISSKEDKARKMGRGRRKRIKVSNERYINVFARDCTVESRFHRPYYSGLETITVQGQKKPSELFSNGPFGYNPYEPIVRTSENYLKFRKIDAQDLPAGLDDVKDAVGWTQARSVIWDLRHEGINHVHNVGADDITYLIGTRFPGPPIVRVDNDDNEKEEFYDGNLHRVVDLDGVDPVGVWVGVQDYLTTPPSAKEIKMSHDEKAKLYEISKRIADDVRKHKSGRSRAPSSSSSSSSHRRSRPSSLQSSPPSRSASSDTNNVHFRYGKHGSTSPHGSTNSATHAVEKALHQRTG